MVKSWEDVTGAIRSEVPKSYKDMGCAQRLSKAAPSLVTVRKSEEWLRPSGGL